MPHDRQCPRYPCSECTPAVRDLSSHAVRLPLRLRDAHDGTGGSSTSVWIFRDYSRLHHRRGTAEKKTPQGDFCHSGAHARPTTELAEARRAFGFFETIHACITAGAQPRKDTARRLLPFQSPCKTHEGKISGDTAKVFVASVFDARRIADELSVPFLWQCCDTGIQPDWVEETLEDSAVTFRFPKSQNTGLDTASHFGRMFVPRLSKCRPERYIR